MRLTALSAASLKAMRASGLGLVRHVTSWAMGSVRAQPERLIGSRLTVVPSASTVSPCSVRCTGAWSQPKKSAPRDAPRGQRARVRIGARGGRELV
eukprot:6717012-Prymnesium_polylepis.1